MAVYKCTCLFVLLQGYFGAMGCLMEYMQLGQQLNDMHSKHKQQNGHR